MAKAVSESAISRPVVTSIKDERLALVRSLGTRAGREASGRCLLEGRTLIGQVLEAGSAIVVGLRAQGTDGSDDDRLEADLLAAGVPVHRVRDPVLRQIAGVSRPVSWWAAAVLPGEVDRARPWGEFALVCEGVADPGNLGSLVRTAQALGVEDVVLTDPYTDVGSRRVLDASRGAVLSSRVRRYASPVEAMAGMRAAGFQLVVTSPRGRQLQGLAALDGRPVALVVGAENAGVSAATAAQADLLVQIPMTGSVESLNVGVAAGIGV